MMDAARPSTVRADEPTLLRLSRRPQTKLHVSLTPKNRIRNVARRRPARRRLIFDAEKGPDEMTVDHEQLENELKEELKRNVDEKCAKWGIDFWADPAEGVYFR